MAGKTRAVFELLKHSIFTNYVIIKPSFETTKEDIIDYLKENKNSKCLFFYDDLNEYISNSKSDINEILDCLTKERQIIIGTIMSGIQYSQYEIKISNSNQEYFKEFSIGRFDIESIKNNLQKINKDSFNGTVGSLLVPLKEMHKRYRFLKEKGKKQKNYYYAFELLEILKVFFLLLNFESSNQYNEEKVFRYFKARNPNAKKVVFKQALSILEDVGFISRKRIKNLVIDSVYFDEIIYSNNIKDYFLEINHFFSSQEEKTELGFYLGQSRLNSLLHEAKNQKEIDVIFDRMQFEEVNKNITTYNILLSKSNSVKQAKKIWVEIGNKKIRKNSMTYHRYLKFLGTNEAKELWEEMDGALKNTYIFNTYLKKLDKEDAKKAWSGFGRRKKNISTYNTYLKNLDVEEARVLWEKIEKKGIEKTPFIYLTFLDLHKSKEGMKYILQFMLHEKEKFYRHILISRLKEFITSEEVIEFILRHKTTILKNQSIVEKFAVILEAYHNPSTSKLAISLILELENKNPKTYNILGNCYRHTEPELAIEYYKKAINYEKKDGKKERFYNNICSLIIKSKLIDKEDLAIESAKKAMKLSNIDFFHHPFYNYLFLKIKNSKSESEIVNEVREFQEKYNLRKRKIYRELKTYPLKSEILDFIKNIRS
ncbi:MAG: hypothetical protein JXQ93_03190 [Flavobacteriaceae bacterium]